MKTRNYISVVLLSSLFLFSGCKRRDLNYEYFKGAQVNINMDWGNTNPKPEHLRLLLYPVEGETPLSYYIEPDGQNINVPYGTYRSLLYNWRSNGDTQYITFENIGDYKQIRAGTRLLSSLFFEDGVLVQPDSLYCWSSGEELFVLTPANSVQTRAGNGLNIRPRSLVKSYDFHIPATGLKYVKSAEAAVSGMSRYLMLYTGDVDPAEYRMSVTMTPQSDRIECHFSILGYVPDAVHTLEVKFKLIDGTSFEVTYDITQEVKDGTILNNKAPINIPKVTGSENGFTNPEIGGWEEMEDDIVF